MNNDTPARAVVKSRPWLLHLCLLALCVTLSAGSNAAVSVGGLIDAKVTNPGFIVVDNGGAYTLTPLDDELTAFATTNFGGPVYNVAAKVGSTLSNSVFGLGGTVSATSAFGVGSLRSGVGGGYIDFNDEIQILSPSLTNGTPVDIQFSFFAAQTRSLFHTGPGIIGNAAAATYQFAGNINSSVSSANNIFISNGNNRVQHIFGSPPSFETGIMDATTPQLDVIYSGTVGETVSVHFRVLAAISVAVRSSGVGEVNVHSGDASGAVAVSFGTTPSVGDVTLQSQIFGGAFPGSAQANFSNSNMALSSFTPIPLPPMVYAFVLSLSALARVSRRTA